MTTLTNADKAQVINSRLKNLLYVKYNLDVDKIVKMQNLFQMHQ